MKKDDPQPIFLILNNARSAFNVGSIFRTADAVGVARVYVCGYSPTPEHPKVAKTSLGAEKFVSWEYHAQAWRLLRKLKVENEKLKIIALEQSPKSKNIFKYKLETRNSQLETVCLVVGNEVRGLGPQILSYCDEVLEIPMYGKKESLNVSVATGVALYALVNKK